MVSCGGPCQAQAFGHRLFFDTRLSGNGAISCATCHQPQKRFTDGLTLSRAIGTTKRNAPSVVGVGYSPWLYWDGRKDSLWSQALAPLEDAAEHGGNRVDLRVQFHHSCTDGVGAYRFIEDLLSCGSRKCAGIFFRLVDRGFRIGYRVLSDFAARHEAG